MYYKSGNFEAFARPRKPKGVDENRVYRRIRHRLAGRGRIPHPRRANGWQPYHHPRGGEAARRHWTASSTPRGFMIRGDREQSDDMVCLWDLMRSIPSLEVENASVLDEFYWLQKDDPHRSLRRDDPGSRRGCPYGRQVHPVEPGAARDEPAVALPATRTCSTRR